MIIINNINITNSLHKKKSTKVLLLKKKVVPKVLLLKKKVVPGLEPGLVDSKSTVITNYTIQPRSAPGIEPGTSCTQSKNHTSRPSGLVTILTQLV